jgi:hypothetical protein
MKNFMLKLMNDEALDVKADDYKEEDGWMKFYIVEKDIEKIVFQCTNRGILYIFTKDIQ